MYYVVLLFSINWSNFPKDIKSFFEDKWYMVEKQPEKSSFFKINIHYISSSYITKYFGLVMLDSKYLLLLLSVKRF